MCESGFMRGNRTLNPDRFAAAALGAVVVFVGLYYFFVRTHDGQLVDQLAYDGADYGWRTVTPVTRRLLDALPAVSGVAGLILTLVISLVRRSVVTLIVALGAAAAAAATTQVLKYGLLSRPDLGVEGFADNSFPSGHTTVAAASALAVFLVASPRARPAVAAWGTAFTVLAGVSTLANQWHRPSDVVAALLVVSFWGCVGGAVLAALMSASARATPTRRKPGGKRWLLVVPFLLVAVVAFVVTFVGASSASATSSTLFAYIGGATGIIAAGSVLAVAATRVFARLP
ncbi:MAG: PA-phosphatase [Cryobacterium sp.]|nr:PA-phosphatase [Cryobacterium sp.]